MDKIKKKEKRDRQKSDKIKFAKVTNKEIKDAMRSKFRAAKVDIAISWLVDYGALEVLPLTEKYGPGRPVGAWYLNRMGVGRA